MITFASSHLTHAFAHHQRGLVVVELAIALPLIVLIMFATAELGRALFQYSTLTKAVEAGTRYYASNPVRATSLDTINNLIVYASPTGFDPDGTTSSTVLPGFSIAKVTVENPLDGHVSVSASYDFDPIIGKLPIIGKVLGFNLTMTATQTMRAL